MTIENATSSNSRRYYFGYYHSSGVTGAGYVDDLVMDLSTQVGEGFRIQEGVSIGSCPYF